MSNKSLSQIDTYSLLLFVLYQMKGIKEYSTLSELIYVLDKDNFFKLLDYFGGITITIPTKKELETLLNALLLYQYTQIEGLSLSYAIKKLEHTDNTKLSEIKDTYEKVCEIMRSFDVN